MVAQAARQVGQRRRDCIEQIRIENHDDLPITQPIVVTFALLSTTTRQMDYSSTPRLAAGTSSFVRSFLSSFFPATDTCL